MWPEILKSLRRGLVFNPLDELQKRATQYGEGIGYDLQAKHAQAEYAKAHPESSRAQSERMLNAVSLALQTWKPVESVPAEHLAQIDKSAPERVVAPAMANKKSGLYNTGVAHYEAIPNLLRKLAEMGHTVDADVHGWLTSKGRIVSDNVAYRLKKAELSPEVQAQIDTRVEQSGKPARLTSEDVRGKLTPNRGTRAAPPITGTEMNEIVQRKASGALPDIGEDALDALNKRGGFSYDPRTGYPIGSGFAVGAGSEPGHALLKVPLHTLTSRAIQDWFAQNAAKFPKGSVVGGWVDNGHAYIEPSTLVDDEAAAHALGAQRGEKEIYDFKRKQSVPVRQPETAVLDSVLPATGKIVGTIVNGKRMDFGSVPPEKVGIEAPAPTISMKIPKGWPGTSGIAGFIQPGDETAAAQLSADNLRTVTPPLAKLIQALKLIR